MLIDLRGKLHVITSHISAGKRGVFDLGQQAVQGVTKFVKHGFGITTLLEMVIAEDADLVALPFEQPVWLDLSVAWRQGGYLSRANRTFVDFLLEHSNAQT